MSFGIGFITGLFILGLIAEKILHDRRLKKISLRITVSGTRGKSTTVRLAAAALREAGYRVMAKTTGSDARYILPDGSEEIVKRRGLVTILEQKRLVSRAIRSGADCLIAEIMSIHPENHKVETRFLLKPHLTLLTNFRPDHLNVTNPDIQSITSLHLNDLNPGSTVWVPVEEVNETLTQGALPLGVTLKSADGPLVIALTRHLGIPDETAEKGMTQAKFDSGRTRVFRLERSDGPVWMISLFAANEPLSSKQMIDRILTRHNLETHPLAALLNLRPDRPERSAQWLRWLDREGRGLFSRIYATGHHSRILERRLEKTRALSGTAEQITRQILQDLPSGAVLIGLANIGGKGRELADHWDLIANELFIGDI